MSSVPENRGWKAILEDYEHGERLTDPAFWSEFLARNPDILHRLLADMYQAVHGSKATPNLDALWELVQAPEYSLEPFGTSVEAALGGRSVRWLAQQIGIHRVQLQRQMNGERPIISPHDPRGSMKRIEVVAKALGVSPAYFREWRLLWLMHVVEQTFTAHPELSVDLFRRFAGLARRSHRAKS